MPGHKKKIILISSSTGGHALPVNYLYERLLADGFATQIFHSGSSLEQKIFEGKKKIKILSGRIQRHTPVKNIFEALKIAFGFTQALFILLFSRPKLIFSKGGFCAVPVLAAAKILHIPYILHESDIAMGRSNRMFSSDAREAFVSFPPKQYSGLEQKNLLYSGLIIKRQASDRKITKTEPVIFVTGGSQGAEQINQVIYELLPETLKKYKIIHQVGEQNLANAESVFGQLPPLLREKYQYFGFSNEQVEEALNVADLIIARAGATTIGEIALLKKASILIPYPHAASDHQLKNARYLEKSGATIMIKENDLSAKILIDRINFIFNNDKNAMTLGHNAAKIVKVDGLNYISNWIEKYLQTEKK